MFNRELQVKMVKGKKKTTEEPVDQPDHTFEEKTTVVVKAFKSVGKMVLLGIGVVITLDTARQVIVAEANKQ